MLSCVKVTGSLHQEASNYIVTNPQSKAHSRNQSVSDQVTFDINTFGTARALVNRRSSRLLRLSLQAPRLLGLALPKFHQYWWSQLQIMSVITACSCSEAVVESKSTNYSFRLFLWPEGIDRSFENSRAMLEKSWLC